MRLEERLNSGEDAPDNSKDTKIIIPETNKDPNQSEQKNRIHLQFFNFDKLNSSNKFFVLSSLIFGLYLTYGYTHEFIFNIPGMKDKGWTVTTLQFTFYALISILDMYLQGVQRKASLSIYVLIASITLISMGFSNACLQYLNYPMQVIFKSCKLIPVLIGGTLIQGKTYGALDYIAASVMCLGLVLFMTVDIQMNPSFNFIGVGMILIALVADAMMGNYQERTMRHFEACNAEMSFYTFSIGALMLLVLQCIFGNLFQTLTFFNSNPVPIYGSIFMFSLTGYLGIQAVFSFIRYFGAFNTVVVTSSRKVFTIILSFILFGKPFSMGYAYSGAIIFFGIYLNLLAKKGYDVNDIVLLLKKCIGIIQ